ncbi:MAG TPA: hypothetical protein VFB79_10375, partial [Candidatus Angelobacter sp.]|nr:hypothetical protein [Candidatus Angelobacter sp.]
MAPEAPFFARIPSSSTYSVCLVVSACTQRPLPHTDYSPIIRLSCLFATVEFGLFPAFHVGVVEKGRNQHAAARCDLKQNLKNLGGPG